MEDKNVVWSIDEWTICLEGGVYVLYRGRTEVDEDDNFEVLYGLAKIYRENEQK